MAVEIEAEIPVLFGEKLVGKKASFASFCGQKAVLLGNLCDSDGKYVEIPENGILIAKYREAIQGRWENGDAPEILDRKTGRFRWSAPVMQQSGIYDLIVAVQEENGDIGVMDSFFIYMQPSPWTVRAYQGIGVPDLDTLRISLRDSVLEENELWRHRQNQLTDICEAAILTIQTWNEQPPHSPALSFSSSTFPLLVVLVQGITMYLASMLVEHYRKNSLQYQAAGITISDSKLQEYLTHYADLRQQFMQNIMQNKYQMNLKRLFSII